MLIDLNVVFLILALLSIVVSIFAVWQANTYKRDSDASSMQAQEALAQLTSEARSLREFAIPELKSYGDAMREFMFKAQIKSSLAGETSISTPTPIATATLTATKLISPETEKNLRADILSTVKQLIKTQGKAPSMVVFDKLKDRYEFGIIFSEILSLRDEGIFRWPGDQNAPQAHVGIEIVEPSGKH